MLNKTIMRLGIIRLMIASVIFFVLLASGLSLIIGLLLGNQHLLRSIFTASICAILIATPVVYAFIIVIRKLYDSQMELETANNQLRAALDQVKTLSGLLPICSSCKKIRDNTGYWNQLESYIESHSSALFSHGLCNECAEEMYGAQGWFEKVKVRLKN